MLAARALRILRVSRSSSVRPISATTRPVPTTSPKSWILPALSQRLAHGAGGTPPYHNSAKPIQCPSLITRSNASQEYASTHCGPRSGKENEQLKTITSQDNRDGLGYQSRRRVPSPLWISENCPYPPRRRVFVSGALGHGISKRRSIVKRSFANSANSSNAAAAVSEKGSKKSPVTWREALKSPRKAITYAGQLRRALVDWAKHMWAGVKLLAADVRVSSRIMKRITHGKQITRRERNFIVKTGVDLARLVPFSLFLIIPLAEFALPFALRLFPNMLPSQFQDQMKQEEDMKRSLKGRLELAKYLRDVVEEKAKTIKASDTNSVSSACSASLSARASSVALISDHPMFLWTGVKAKCGRPYRVSGSHKKRKGC